MPKKSKVTKSRGVVATTTLPEDIYCKLEKIAKTNRWSISATIAILLERNLEDSSNGWDTK